MMPDEELPLPANDGGGTNFPDIPTNDRGQLAPPPINVFPDVPVNDVGLKLDLDLTPPDIFLDLDINDRGIDSESA